LNGTLSAIINEEGYEKIKICSEVNDVEQTSFVKEVS